MEQCYWADVHDANSWGDGGIVGSLVLRFG
jgi:hypothetical protein